MLSLAAMLAVLSYASPASAELKIGGDASVRARGQFNSSKLATGAKGLTTDDNLVYQYRVRLKASADLGDGYFFKSLVQNEGVAGGWQSVSLLGTERNPLEVSNFYFGRTLKDCNYSLGRLPLNSFNNPIFDLALYPVPTAFTSSGIYAVDVPVATHNFDRVFGFNYGTKVGDGNLNAALVVLDNNSTSVGVAGRVDGLLNDGYALHLSYKTTAGDVTLEPQALIVLTDAQGTAYQKVSPNTFGLNATVPAGKSKIGASAFYTTCKDSKGATSTYAVTYPATSTTAVAPAPTVASTQTAANVNYSGYLLRLKGESGPAMAWIDYNRTKDKSTGTGLTETTYNNIFVWAQYNFKVQESAAATFNVTPTIRYRTSGKEVAGSTVTQKNNQLRGELYATVTF